MKELSWKGKKTGRKGTSGDKGLTITLLEETPRKRRGRV